jgi:hypothetical protein
MGKMWLPVFVDAGVQIALSWVYLREFLELSEIIWGPGEYDLCKNLKLNISWHCPLIFQL